MKNFIAEKISKTSKDTIKRLYFQGKQLLESNFTPGSHFSYDIDFNKKTVKIIPNDDLQFKGTVSRKKQKNNVVPVIDINNKNIINAFDGYNQCKITFYEDEIIIKAYEEVDNVVEFKKEIVIDKADLDNVLGKVVGFGDTFTDSVFNWSKDSFTQKIKNSIYHKKNSKILDTTLKVLSLFSGIGAFEEALNNLGVNHKIINYCEKKEYIARAYSIIHNIDEKYNLGDITQVDPYYLDDFNLMTYGFPCQDISALGSKKGLIDNEGNLTRSGLFYKAMEIADVKRPEYMIAENVQRLVSKDMKKDFNNMLHLLDDLNYNTYWKKLNTKNYGIPQSRNRVFLISIRKDIDDYSFDFPEKIPLTIKAKDLYDEYAEDEYYLEERHSKYYEDFKLKKRYSSLNSDVLICMTTKQGGKSNPQNFIKDEKGIRTLTAREMFAFQGFKRKYGDILKKAGFTMKQIGHMLGNSITVNVLEKILLKLLPKQYFTNIIPLK